PQYLASSPFLSRYADRSVVVPYGVDMNRVALRDNELEAVRQLQHAHEGRLVLFVGVLRYYKGVDVLVRAMKDVRGHAVVVGRGSDETPLRELAATLGVADRI